MDIKDILKELKYCDEGWRFQREALTQAIANQGQVIPELLKTIGHATQNMEAIPNYYMGHIYAMFLLAQFREKRAYPLIADFFSVPGEISLDVTGDVVTECLCRILASVSCGDASLMKKLVEDRGVNEYVRSAALEGIVTLVVCGEKFREEVMAYFQSLFRGKLEREPSHIWNALAVCSSELYPREVYEDIRQAYEDGLVESSSMGFEEVERDLSLGREKVLNDLQNNGHYSLIEDTIREMEYWACFTETVHRQVVGKTPKIG